MAQSLNEIRGLLKTHGLRPKKRYGQHFLHDANHMRKIVAAARVSRDDVVLEVGPGTGALSEHLLQAGARLVAVEVDRDFEPILADCFDPFGDRTDLLFADILDCKGSINVDVIEVIQKRLKRSSQLTNGSRRTGAFKLVGNLAYNLASPLLANLALDHPQMSNAVVTIQREVADRLLANPGTKAYGPLGIMVGAMCHVERISQISPRCFWPMPMVESVVVRLERRDDLLTDDPPALARLVKRLFTKRRKQLGRILGSRSAVPADLDPTMRPEQLSIQQLVDLARHLG